MVKLAVVAVSGQMMLKDRWHVYFFFLCSFLSFCACLTLSLSVSSEVTVSSLLCLSSVRELPVQVCELYQKGFVLAAVHPFVHSCGPASANLQKQLHRAVLIRQTHRYANKPSACLLHTNNVWYTSFNIFNSNTFALYTTMLHS